MTELLDTLLKLAGLVLTLGLVYLGKFIRERFKTGVAREAMLELVDAGRVVVRDVEQRVRPALVKASADGKLSAGDCAELKTEAMTALKDQLSDQAQKVIKANGTRLEEAMSRAIESAVLEQKQAAPKLSLGVPAIARVAPL